MLDAKTVWNATIRALEATSPRVARWAVRRRSLLFPLVIDALEGVIVPKEYHYGATLRPIGYATVPSGYIREEAHPDYRWGVVVYGRPLTEEERRRYDLMYLMSDDEREAWIQKTVEDLAGDPETAEAICELAEEDPDSLKDTAGFYIERARQKGLDVGVDRETLTRAILAKVARAVPGLRGGLRGTTRPNPIYLTEMPLLDAEGRKYRARYFVLATRTDGRGPIVVSSEPETFRPIPGYPSVFQARNLQEPAEAAKVRTIAENLDPDRVVWCNLDPTLGAPVAWRGSGEQGTDRNAWYVLGGNARTIAILMAPEDRYTAYLAALRERWPGLVPPEPAPSGHRYVMIREVFREDGRPLTLNEAMALAGASQRATAGEESVLGKALSLIRGLGLHKVKELPPFDWTRPLHAGNAHEFVAQNPAFWEFLLSRMDPAQREAIKLRPEKAAELLKSVMVGYLPEEVRELGLGGRKEAEALLSAVPMILSLHSAVIAGTAKPKWDLLPELADAAAFGRMIAKRRLSVKKIEKLLDQEARQQRVEGAKSLLGELSPLGAMLGLALKKAAARADPETAIGEYLTPYTEAALSDVVQQAGLF